MTLAKGYEGVKFECVLLDHDKNVFENFKKKYLQKFKQIAKALDENDWAPCNGGNYSIKTPEGFVITASGSCFSEFKDEETVLVTEIDVDAKKVFYYSKNGREPSSEAILHHLLYEKFGCNAILHCHADVLTYCERLSDYCTKEEFPYGTVELAKAAAEDMKDDFVILKNHGVVAIGDDLDECMEKIKEKLIL